MGKSWEISDKGLIVEDIMHKKVLGESIAYDTASNLFHGPSIYEPMVLSRTGKEDEDRASRGYVE